MRLPLALALVAAPLLLAAGCDVLTNRPPLARDYGAPYAVRNGVVVGFPGEVERRTPAITATGDLWVVVRYRGGCGEHAFDLERDAVQGGSIIWLEHLVSDETCDETIDDTLRVSLSAALRPGGTQPALALATPDGDELAILLPSGGEE